VTQLSKSKRRSLAAIGNGCAIPAEAGKPSCPGERWIPACAENGNSLCPSIALAAMQMSWAKKWIPACAGMTARVSVNRALTCR
jgi:hypothetical protein